MNLKKKLFYYLLFIFNIFIIILFFGFVPNLYAYPKLVSNIISAFEKVKNYIVGISTPAVAVSIGCGFLMQKFSFGDEERIRTGKKLIRTSFLSYSFILSLDLLVSLIENLIS